MGYPEKWDFSKSYLKKREHQNTCLEDIAGSTDELESNTTEVESEDSIDLSQEEDSLDSLLGDDNSRN